MIHRSQIGLEDIIRRHLASRECFCAGLQHKFPISHSASALSSPAPQFPITTQPASALNTPLPLSQPQLSIPYYHSASLSSQFPITTQPASALNTPLPLSQPQLSIPYYHSASLSSQFPITTQPASALNSSLPLSLSPLSPSSSIPHYHSALALCSPAPQFPTLSSALAPQIPNTTPQLMYTSAHLYIGN